MGAIKSKLRHVKTRKLSRKRKGGGPKSAALNKTSRVRNVATRRAGVARSLRAHTIRRLRAATNSAEKRHIEEEANVNMAHAMEQARRNVLANLSRPIKKKKSLKKLMKNAVKRHDDPFNTLKHMRKFLSKAIDTYEELQEDEVEGKLNAADSKQKDMFDQIFLILGEDIVEFSEKNMDDMMELGDYGELSDKDILEENPIDYMKMFYDYLTDVLKDYKSSPSEDSFVTMDELQVIIRRVLSDYVEKKPSKANVPVAVKDELDDLLGSIEGMKL